MGKKTAATTATGEITNNGSLMNVPFDLLQEVEGFNIRKDMGNIKQLAAQIRTNGVTTPLRGYKEGVKVNIVDGHRRMAALQLIAGEGVNDGDLVDLSSVPVIFEDESITPEDMIVKMVIANEGKPLEPLEQAEAVSRLSGEPFNWKGNKIAEKLGFTPAWVSKLGLLLKAPEPLRIAVAKGNLAATKLMDIVKAKKTEEAITALNEGSDMESIDTEAKQPDNTKSSNKKMKDKVAAATKELNSFKEFKKAAVMIDKKRIIDEAKRAQFVFMTKVANNDYDYDAFMRYFKQSND